MRAGIDFDRVLFDTDEFNQYLRDNVEGFYHTEEEPYDEYGNYDPVRHAEILEIPVERIFNAVKNADRFLYSDVEKLEQLEAIPVIVSRGNPRFQREKIKNSGVLEYVESFHIIQKGTKNLDNIDLLIDDSKEEIKKVDIPSFHFNRDKHTIEDLVEWLNNNAA